MEDGGLYRVNRPEKVFLANTIELWHRRLGHLNEGSLKKPKKVGSKIDFKNETRSLIVSFALRVSRHDSHSPPAILRQRTY